MANFSALKTAIQNAIKQNGNEEITGDVLQQILLSIVNTMGDGAINTIEQNLSSETLARQNGDNTLQQNIDAEALARGNADTQLQNAINAIKANIDNGYVYAGIATPSSTPVSGKVFYIAIAAGTYTNFGGQVLTQGINILRYNGSAWSNQQLIGIDDVPTVGSNNIVKSGGVQNELALGAVYDVSAKNPTAGPNNDGKWESLSALLSDTNLNTLIPTAYRKGGMSIKFVHTNDNKYVQARCMADSFTTDVTQWQGIDDEPTFGSKNLVKSGGVYISEKGLYTLHHYNFVTLSGCLMACSRYIKTYGKKVTVYLKQMSGNYRIIVYQFNANGSALGYYSPSIFVDNKIVYTGNAAFIKVVVAKNTGSYVDITSADLDNFSVLCDFPEYNVKTEKEYVSIIDKSSYKIIQQFNKDILKLADNYFFVVNNGEFSAKVLFDVVENVASTTERYIFQPWGYDNNLKEIEALTNEYVADCNLTSLTYKYVSLRILKQIKVNNNWRPTDITLQDVEKFDTLVKKNFCDFACFIEKSKNITLNVLGDSITEQGYYTTALSNLGYTINNYGISGTTISTVRQSNYFKSRVAGMADTCDAVIVFGGVNDWVLGAPLGTKFETTDESKFYPALNELFLALRNKYVNKPIFVCTPLHSQFVLQGYDSKLEYSENNNQITANAYGNGDILSKYVQAIKDVAQLYSIQVIDTYSESGMAALIPSNNAAYYQDGLHPNAAGGVLVANCIDKYIKRLKD